VQRLHAAEFLCRLKAGFGHTFQGFSGDGGIEVRDRVDGLYWRIGPRCHYHAGVEQVSPDVGAFFDPLLAELGIRLLPLLGNLALEKLSSVSLLLKISLTATLMVIVSILTLKRQLINLFFRVAESTSLGLS
jgi:hypothetical protein